MVQGKSIKWPNKLIQAEKTMHVKHKYFGQKVGHGDLAGFLSLNKSHGAKGRGIKSSCE